MTCFFSSAEVFMSFTVKSPTCFQTEFFPAWLVVSSVSFPGHLSVETLKAFSRVYFDVGVALCCLPSAFFHAWRWWTLIPVKA